MIGNEAGTAEVAEAMQVRHLPDVDRNEFSTPLLSSVFSAAKDNSRSPVMVFCNCDMILFEDFVHAVGRLYDHPKLSKFLAIGRRTDLVVHDQVDFDSELEIRKLRLRACRRGRAASIVCKDFFAFPREWFPELPDFAIGRGNWDNWMVKQAKREEVPVVSVSDCVLAVHQVHDYTHHQGNRFNAYLSGPEARQNQRLAGGRHLLSGSTSDLRIDAAGRLYRNRTASVHGEFWRDFPRFAQLLLDFLGSR